MSLKDRIKKYGVKGYSKRKTWIDDLTKEQRDELEQFKKEFNDGLYAEYTTRSLALSVKEEFNTPVTVTHIAKWLITNES